MKNLILSYCIMMLACVASAQKIIKAKKAHKYIGQEVIVTGKLITFGNSSYAQFANFVLGSDSNHIQLNVVLQGVYYQKETYQNINAKPNMDCWIGNWIGKNVEIKGIIKLDDKKNVWMDATDELVLK